MVAEQGEAHNFSQGALVAMDVSGSVKAVVGGADYTQSQYNRAVTARRQPGSAFKPMVYLTALERGYTPESLVEDAPFTYQGWSPANYNNQYAGTVRVRDALARSLNTVAARLAIDVGPQNVVETAYRMGISPPLDPVPSVALGVNEVSLLDLTAAYAPFANGGIGVIAHVITRIETADGEVLYENIPAGPGRVVAPEHVAMMNSMLSDAVQVGTGRAARLDGWPIAGKTGTTQESRDAVFVGYTSRLITGVWLGNDDSTPMNGVGGGSYPVQIWSEFMSRAHQGLAVTDLPGRYSASPIPNFDGETSTSRDTRTIVDVINGIFGWE
jgi:penicillin-binding protein 1A